MCLVGVSNYHREMELFSAKIICSELNVVNNEQRVQCTCIIHHIMDPLDLHYDENFCLFSCSGALLQHSGHSPHGDLRAAGARRAETVRASYRGAQHVQDEGDILGRGVQRLPGRGEEGDLQPRTGRPRQHPLRTNIRRQQGKVSLKTLMRKSLISLALE